MQVQKVGHNKPYFIATESLRTQALKSDFKKLQLFASRDVFVSRSVDYTAEKV